MTVTPPIPLKFIANILTTVNTEDFHGKTFRIKFHPKQIRTDEKMTSESLQTQESFKYGFNIHLVPFLLSRLARSVLDNDISLLSAITELGANLGDPQGVLHPGNSIGDRFPLD
ncbi:hypothetical protein QLX08_002220 [Tetragonisca angustula]|uniref:Uncharacterized protein n=1 Tax=Tetragonisca angustula TaxID=166442 RepID=A0AAW1AE41_9HYME